MANGKRLLRFTAVLVVLAGVLGFQLEAMGMLESSANDAEGRPDVIMIDTIARLGTLEQSPAVFFHDAHTKALKKQGMNCESCHKKDDKGQLVYTFARLEGEGQPELSAGELKDIYHDNCISCHVATGEKNLKTGPMVGECRSCHQERPKVKADRVPAGMDNILHYTHWNSREIPVDAGKNTNCGACHTKQGSEDSWRFATEGESLKDVFHNQCVTCHQDYEVKNKKTGPTQCASCHGASEVAATKAKEAKMLREMGGTLPRLPRKQPDAVLMAPEPVKGSAPAKPMGMAPVAFNHKFHEGAVDTCRTCHEKGVNAPMDTSFKALHDVSSDTSCIGCHAKEQERPECAGCHFMRNESKAMSEASCVSCHKPLEGDTEALMVAPKEVKAAEAMTLIAARPQTQMLPALDAIPETVTIGAMADEYKPSLMPHRKIVLSMVEKMNGSELAATFHATPEALCAGCHHNSPASLTPPKCGSCHAKPFQTEGKPGLKAAYHGQCMGCHTKMKLEKPAATNCVACHEKKN